MFHQTIKICYQNDLITCLRKTFSPQLCLMVMNQRLSTTVPKKPMDDNDDECDEDHHLAAKFAPLRALKGKSSSNQMKHHQFIDYKKVRVKGGKGGDGMICFLQLWCNPMAGPSGGDGGNGGHVLFEASTNTKCLNQIKSSYCGLPGENGMHKDMAGKNAKHLILPVPVGTLVKHGHTQQTVADLHSNGMKFLAAKGGAGGKGNHYFLSNKNRHPYVAEVGSKGEENVWILEMKMIAHVGLVGFPNAGKSTLLSALSRARPKIASYPFTTLKPSIGIIQYEDSEQLAIADLPGIIEGAHRNRGLGMDFLRHIERCLCIFYVIDIWTDQDPFEQLMVLRKELSYYNSDLIRRPSTIIVNKMDQNIVDHRQSSSERRLEKLTSDLHNNNLSHLKVIPVSAKYGDNLVQILIHLRQICDADGNRLINK